MESIISGFQAAFYLIAGLNQELLGIILLIPGGFRPGPCPFGPIGIAFSRTYGIEKIPGPWDPGHPSEYLYGICRRWWSVFLFICFFPEAGRWVFWAFYTPRRP